LAVSDSANPPAPVTAREAQPSPRWVIVLVLGIVVASALLLHITKPLSLGTRPGAGTGGNGTVTPVSTLPSNTIPRAQVIVQVANSTTTNGLARRYSDQLQIQGWNTLQALQVPPVAKTVVYYTNSYASEARTIASEIGVTNVRPLNGAPVVPGATQDAVIVILGPDLAG
jgi:LytR cell envelope-related transcriptional attenuator